MPFLAHLDELRGRLRNACIALLAGIAIAYPFRTSLFALMARPLFEAWEEAAKMARSAARRWFTRRRSSRSWCNSSCRCSWAS